jgi:N-acetylmuramoyl-L-alanine amidase
MASGNMRRLFPFTLLLIAAVFMAGCAGVKDTTRTFHTVVIDAGHGGHDTGARSRAGVAEKSATLDVALRLNQKLRDVGFRTVLTRADDTFIPLEQRAGISNSQDNAVFVSIHFNDSRARWAHGVETYYKSGPGRVLASRIERSLVELPGAADRGVKPANFRVLKLAQYPAVLVECGFLSNGFEANLVKSGAHRDALATKIAEALVGQRFGENSELLAKLRGAPAVQFAQAPSYPTPAAQIRLR